MPPLVPIHLEHRHESSEPHPRPGGHRLRPRRLLSAASAWAADFKVGFITSLSGPVSSLGIPYEKGMKAALAYKSEVGGRKIQLVQLDDASDPSTAARNARKMIDEDKVDVIIGTAGSPGALAIAAVARETKTPLISIANANLPGEEGSWMVTLPQPAPLMVSAVVERMKKSGVKTVGYIGFSDAWGDLVYDALTKSAEPAGIKVRVQRALCARRRLGHRPGAEDRRAASRCGDHRHLGHAGRAALPRALGARLQGPDLRHACVDQPRLRARRAALRSRASWHPPAR